MDLAVFHDGGQVGAHGGCRGNGHGIVLGALVHVQRPGVEPFVGFRRHAQHSRDDLDGELARDLCHQIRTRAPGQAVEEAVDGGGDELALPPGQGRRPEGMGHEIAVAAMLLAVHGYQGWPHDGAHGVIVDAAREARGVSQHALDIGVIRHQPDIGPVPAEAPHGPVASGTRPSSRRCRSRFLPRRFFAPYGTGCSANSQSGGSSQSESARTPPRPDASSAGEVITMITKRRNPMAWMIEHHTHRDWMHEQLLGEEVDDHPDAEDGQEQSGQVDRAWSAERHATRQAQEASSEGSRRDRGWERGCPGNVTSYW